MASDSAERQRIKEILVETLKLEDISPGEIGDDMPLWGEGGLGLDSVDALELMVVLEGKFGIRIDDEEIEPEALATVVQLQALIERLQSSQTGAAAGGEVSGSA